MTEEAPTDATQADTTPTDEPSGPPTEERVREVLRGVEEIGRAHV